MGMFKALVRTTINIALLPVKLPIAIIADTCTVLEDACWEDGVYNRTKGVVEQIKEEADTED